MAEVARALEVNPNVLHRWRREFRQGPGNAFPGNGKQRWSEGRVAELERKVGQQALEIDFLKGCLQHVEEQRMLQALTEIRGLPEGRRRSEGRPGMTIERMWSWPGQPGGLLPLRRERPTGDRTATWTCATPCTDALEWPSYGGRASPQNCAGAAGR